ncbi:Putative disease resistance protein RGA4 [Linum grandiflorum]
MAEAALFNVADWVLKQLGSKLLQEASLLWGIEDDIHKLTRTLSTIQALLLDADQKSSSSSSSSSQSHQRGEVRSAKHELVGREIVDKCKGVPLAVRTIAGALLFRETESEWDEFRNKEMWEMDQELFPKDYEMNVNTLIQLWIAQGYVTSSDIACQYNVGLEYFKGLLWRSFFQEVKQDEWDLSFFQMMSVSQTIHKLKHLRYLDLSGNNMKTLPEEIAGLLNLEVLMLNECRLLEKLPKGTGDLSHLTHLALDGCPALICLPLGIGRLCYLRKLSEFLLCNSTAAAAGIGELQYLKNLRGGLMIQNLDRVNNASEGETANLKDKQYLDELLLSWEGGRDNADVVAEGKLLEALRPHPNLKVITLSCNAGLECPSWLPSITNLVEIRLEESANWKILPPLDQLPFLAKLELDALYSLEYIEVSSAASSTFFPSLKYLKLKFCPKLKGWSNPAEVSLQFPCVSEVTINGCYDITSIPHFSLHLQHLTLSGGSKELLNQILRIDITASSSPPCLSGLEHMDISEITDLDILPENLLLRLSSSMKELGISDCPELRTLSPALPHHLTSLQKLYIYSCEELDLCDGDGIIVLPRLSSVDFKGIPNLSSFPDWLQHAPNLKEIETRDCPIQCIPEWMPKLSKLELLEMRHWGRSVEECIAEDWPKIAHINTIVLDKVCVKKDGCCQGLNDEMEEENGWDSIEVLWGPEEVGEGETSKLVQYVLVLACMFLLMFSYES